MANRTSGKHVERKQAGERSAAQPEPPGGEDEPG
jgi:hypothetical protein